MSTVFAERMSQYPNKGVCGLPEKCDSQGDFASKLDKLSQLIRKSKYTVVLTGAGISTSAGIPDFRGPSGLWTREKERNTRKNRVQEARERENSQRKRKSDESTDEMPEYASFENAEPTFTHRALTHMMLHPPRATRGERRTFLNHVVTQNVDGLHRKANLPRSKMSILHGDIFTEKCDTCETEYVREREIQSIGRQYTGRVCTRGCPGKLTDTLLDWEDTLPEEDLRRAREECSRADLVLCLGTSLRIEPARSLCTYPTKKQKSGEDLCCICGGEWVQGLPGWLMCDGHDGHKKCKNDVCPKCINALSLPVAGKFFCPGCVGGSEKRSTTGYAIVNLQQTPFDKKAMLVVRGKVDDVLKGLMERLGYGCDWDARKSDEESEANINEMSGKKNRITSATKSNLISGRKKARLQESADDKTAGNGTRNNGARNKSSSESVDTDDLIDASKSRPIAHKKNKAPTKTPLSEEEPNTKESRAKVREEKGMGDGDGIGSNLTKHSKAETNNANKESEVEVLSSGRATGNDSNQSEYDQRKAWKVIWSTGPDPNEPEGFAYVNHSRNIRRCQPPADLDWLYFDIVGEGVPPGTFVSMADVEVIRFEHLRWQMNAQGCVDLLDDFVFDIKGRRMTKKQEKIFHFDVRKFQEEGLDGTFEKAFKIKVNILG